MNMKVVSLPESNITPPKLTLQIRKDPTNIALRLIYTVALHPITYRQRFNSFLETRRNVLPRVCGVCLIQMMSLMRYCPPNGAICNRFFVNFEEFGGISLADCVLGT